MTSFSLEAPTARHHTSFAVLVCLTFGLVGFAWFQRPLTPLWIALAVLSAAAAGAFGWAYYRRLSDGRIEIGPGVMSLSIPEADGVARSRLLALSSLDLEGARLVDLRTASEFSPKVRLTGMSLPFYHAGLFALRNGSSAYGLLTSDRAVYVPGAGLAPGLLFSAAHPEEFLERLNQSPV